MFQLNCNIYSKTDQNLQNILPTDPLKDLNLWPGLKTKVGLCAQVRCNYAPLLSFWGISWNGLFLFFSPQKAEIRTMFLIIHNWIRNSSLSVSS